MRSSSSILSKIDNALLDNEVKKHDPFAIGPNDYADEADWHLSVVFGGDQNEANYIDVYWQQTGIDTPEYWQEFSRLQDLGNHLGGVSHLGTITAQFDEIDPARIDSLCELLDIPRHLSGAIIRRWDEPIAPWVTVEERVRDRRAELDREAMDRCSQLANFAIYSGFWDQSDEPATITVGDQEIEVSDWRLNISDVENVANLEPLDFATPRELHGAAQLQIGETDHEH